MKKKIFLALIVFIVIIMTINFYGKSNEEKISDNVTRVKNIEMTYDIYMKDKNYAEIYVVVKNTGMFSKKWEYENYKEIIEIQVTDNKGKWIDFEPIKKIGLGDRKPSVVEPIKTVIKGKEEYKNSKKINLTLRETKKVYEGPIIITITTPFFTKVLKGEVEKAQILINQVKVIEMDK